MNSLMKYCPFPTGNMQIAIHLQRCNSDTGLDRFSAIPGGWLY